MSLDFPPPYDYVIMPIVMILAGFAAWGDLKPMIPHFLGRVSYPLAPHGRISNRLLLRWLVLGLVALPCGYLYAEYLGPFRSLDMVEYTEELYYPAAVTINAGIALVIGFVIWVFKLWAAGDAKMFALLALTLPLAFYERNYFSLFPSFALLFNTFVAMFVILAVEFVASSVMRLRKGGHSHLLDRASEYVGKVKENKAAALRMVFLFLAMFTTIRIVRHFAREGIGQVMEMNKTVLYVVLFLGFHPLMKLAQNRYAFAASILLVSGYLVYAFGFDPTGQALGELVSMSWIVISILLFRVIYDAYLSATDEIEIPCAQVRQGMILGDTTLRKLKERKRFVEQKLGDFSADGLTAEQAASLREWFESNEPGGTLFVSRTIPFAPSLFFGTLITVMVNGLVVVF